MDQRKYRNIAGCFTTGVTVVTTIDREGRPAGLTANSFTSLSLDPPLVLFNIDKSSSLCTDFEQARSFAVNILSHEQENLSRQFAAKGIDRFEHVGFRTGKSGAPVLDNVLAYFDCEVAFRYDGGDHTIMIGRVIDGDEREGEPLVFYKGKYRSLAEL